MRCQTFYDALSKGSYEFERNVSTGNNSTVKIIANYLIRVSTYIAEKMTGFIVLSLVFET